MAQTAFRTNPVALEELLSDCGSGKIQLPDFQRSWVWDEDRIKSLIASISQAFPVGALMTLEMQAGAAETFARRPVEGALKDADRATPNQLLLDGQQRMTSLYQTCMRREVVEMTTTRQKLVRRWFYIDIAAALHSDGNREDAILGVPQDRKVKENFDRDIKLDLSTPEAEYEVLMFPLNRVFDWDEWQEGFGDYWIAKGDPPKRKLFQQFKQEVLQNFKSYRVPVIALGHDTSHEAVCLVFEKVNTGGKALDAFELVTAMYAAQGFRLRDDWLGVPAKDGVAARLGTQSRLQTFGRVANQPCGVLEKVASTDFLQAVSLLHTKQIRRDAIANGVKEGEAPGVKATRQSLLDLPLTGYQAFRDRVEQGFKTAGKFLYSQGIYRVADLPYQTQLVSLAAILAEIGDAWEPAATREKLARWYWCGIFGELYGSAVESRFALDIQQVPAWLQGGPEPVTVRDGIFRPDRLKSMRSRLSAAYKGIHALLMKEGARDFRTGQPYDQSVFFDEAVDIHHVFPQAWCAARKLDPKVYDSIINKTPLGARTNRIIGGRAPSEYLARIQTGDGQHPPIDPATLNQYLGSHGIDPELLRSDDFGAFMVAREQRLLSLIARATGHAVVTGDMPPSEGEDVPEDIARDDGLVLMAAE